MTAVQSVLDSQVLDFVRARFATPKAEPYKSTRHYLPHHTPPEEFLLGTKSVWILEGGRGGGKTYSAAVHYDRLMRETPGLKGRIIAPTIGEALQSCVTGTSGLQTLFPDLKLGSVASTTVVEWPNGSQAAVLGAWTSREIAKMRAISNRTLDWFEEFTSLPQMEETWRQAATGRRIGAPKALITTTPTPHPFWAKLRELSNVVRTHGTMYDNPHLSEQYKREIRELYEGTHLEDQEIWGKIVTDVDGALWTSINISECRVGVGQLGELSMVVVGVDPASGSGTTGIVAAAAWRGDSPITVSDDPNAHVGLETWHVGALADASIRDADPLVWAERAVRLCWQVGADKLVGERNQGGRMVLSSLEVARRHILNDPNLSDAERMFYGGLRIELVNASDGKRTRAEPVALLHEQRRGHIVGKLPELEAELTRHVFDVGMPSPDRLDAYVWAATELLGKFGRGTGSVSLPLQR